MGKHTSYDDNPLGSVILNIMLLMDKKVKSESFKNLIRLKCFETLKDILNNPQQLVYLDFTVKFDRFGDKCEIIPENMISALWFCGVFPEDAEEVITDNKFHLENGYYKYYDKTRKLKFFK